MISPIINLESLLDLSAKLNERYDYEFILNSALLTLMGKLKILRGAVFFPSKDKQKFNLLISKGKQRIESFDFADFPNFKNLDSNLPNEKELIDAGYFYLLPINNLDHLKAVILLSEKIDKSEIPEEEIYYIKLVSIICSIALQNSANYQSLKESNISLETNNQLLTTVFEISKDFSTLLTKNQILKLISYRIMGQLVVSRFALFLLSAENKCEEVINRFAISPMKEIIKELSQVDKVSDFSDLELSNNTKEYINQAKIAIISPMIIQGKSKGFLLIGKKMDGKEFTDDNILFITALSNTSISALENERLFQEELAKKQLEKEMELAFDIQKNLLPKKIPSINGYDLLGISLPSLLVSGDYFDFIKISENKTLIAISDVSGKGMPAALLMANVQAALRALAPLNLSLEEMVMRINKVVFDNTTPEKFVTFFVGVLDAEKNEFLYLNAGHNTPFILRQTGEFDCMTSGGLVLGILEEPFPYETSSVKIESEDVIVFYTDGVTESLNKYKEEFGDEKLKGVMRENSKKSVSEMIDKIILAVDEHSSDMQQTDDITVIALKKK